jgi:hypothetical protein
VQGRQGPLAKVLCVQRPAVLAAGGRSDGAKSSCSCLVVLAQVLACHLSPAAGPPV